MKRFVITIVIVFIILNITTTYSFADEENVIYRVAGDNNFPPYEYVDSDGIYKGFNVDLLKAISLETGIIFEFMPMRWEDAYNAIDHGQADMIQGLKESYVRKEKFLFTDSLLMNSQSIFVRNSTWNISSKNDLAGKTIAINREDSIYYELNYIRDIKIIEYDTIEEALQSLLDEQVDAMIGNTLTVNYLCKETKSTDLVKIVGNSLNEKKYAMAVAKDNKVLLDKLNMGLKAVQKNGMYDLIYRKWFGTPIKNTKDQYELIIKIIISICGVMIVVSFIIYTINKKLKKIIEKKTEEQKVLMNELRKYDKLQFMDKIISSIAHEIRNPLTSIKIYTGQMKEKVDNKEFMLAAAEDIPSEIERIDLLIKEFIEYTSPRKPVRTSFNLYEEVMNSIKFVKMQVKNINIIVDIDKSFYIKFDMYHFKQIILNILLNSQDAVKDTQNPVIEIFAKENKNSIILNFIDNGYGMSEKDIQYIFEPFFTTKCIGNGVGMFVVKQMVEDNGGTICAQSDGKMKGMCITVTAQKGDSNEE